MTTLTQDYDYVIGGDPDRDTIDLAVLDTVTAGLCAHLEESTDAGYARILGWARNHAPGRRVWALEGTGSFAAGLVEELARAGEDVVEIGALKRARGSKNDRLDAVRAARTAMAREHQGSPRIGGLREAIRVLSATRGAVLVSRTKALNELKSLIVVSPESVRAQLRGRRLAEQPRVIETMTRAAAPAVEHRMIVSTMHSITARIRFLTAQLDEIDPELLVLIKAHPAGPALLAETGVGPVVAAQLLISWSHPGRLRSEAAFASLAGVAPLEASSGQRSRHRLNRGGDRALNRALHTVAITRIRCHAETRAYEAGAPCRARPTATSAAVSSAPWPGTFTVSWKPRQPLDPRPRPVDKHRSVQSAPALLVRERLRSLRAYPGGSPQGRRETQPAPAHPQPRDPSQPAEPAAARSLTPGVAPTSCLCPFLHSAIDHHSRVVYSEILTDEKQDTAAGFWQRANAFYAALGITVLRVMTDNGSCYRSRRFNEALGPASHKPTRPYRPQTNGKIERFHRTLAAEWAYARHYASEQARANTYQTWIHDYNHHRPHTGIGGNAPISRIHNVDRKNT